MTARRAALELWAAIAASAAGCDGQQHRGGGTPTLAGPQASGSFRGFGHIGSGQEGAKSGSRPPAEHGPEAQDEAAAPTSGTLELSFSTVFGLYRDLRHWIPKVPKVPKVPRFRRFRLSSRRLLIWARRPLTFSWMWSRTHSRARILRSVGMLIPSRRRSSCWSRSPWRPQPGARRHPGQPQSRLERRRTPRPGDTSQPCRRPPPLP